MVKRVCRVVTVGAAVSMLAVVGGCATAATPATGPAQPSTRSSLSEASRGLVASADSPEPRGNTDFVDGANDSDAAERPTFTTEELSDQVERATRDFLSASLARGYPDKRDKANLRRTKQRMTSEAFVQRQRLDAEQGTAQRVERMYAQHQRTTPKVLIVKPSVTTAERATVTVEYRLITQRADGTKWRTVGVGPTQKRVLALIDQDRGGWIVSSVG